MITVVVGCPGIGKSTFAKENNLFVDLGTLSLTDTFIINKKKQKIFDIKKFDNKIVLQNTIDRDIENIKDCNIVLLNYINVIDILIKRINFRTKTKKNSKFIFLLKNSKKLFISNYKSNYFIFNKINKDKIIINIDKNNIDNLKNMLMSIHLKKDK